MNTIIKNLCLRYKKEAKESNVVRVAQMGSSWMRVTVWSGDILSRVNEIAEIVSETIIGV